jgi:zinc transporter ZupT
LIGIANAFSGGIFLCVALLHLLPESSEIFEEYFDHPHEQDEKEHKHFPMSFLLALCGYSLILMIEKVIFESHSHLEVDDEEDLNNESGEENQNLLDEEVQMVNVNNTYNITIPLSGKKNMSNKFF